ncbi:MAG TPA: hypothetical protein ENK23_01360 [Sorangium sp.]|nr:hypothetical protein [Sorangium sp.]
MSSSNTALTAQQPDSTFRLRPIRAFAHLLEHAVTGVVEVVETPTRIHRIWLHAGTPTHIHTAVVCAPLVELLAALPGADVTTLNTLTNASSNETALADAVMTAGIINADQLRAARKHQQLLRLDRLFRLPADTTFRVYFLPHPATDEQLDHNIDSREVFLRAAQQACNRDTVDGYIDRLRDSPLRTAPGLTAIPDSFSSAERLVADMLDDTVTVAELLAAADDPLTVHNVVFALSMSHSIRRMSLLPQAPVASTRQPRRPTAASARSNRSCDVPRSYASTDHRHAAASHAFERAETALRQLNYPAAREAIQSALAQQPNNPTYQAMEVFVQAEEKLATGHAPNKLTQEVADLSRIIDAFPDTELAYYSRARLRQRQRRISDAMRDFAMAAELNPQNSHAVAEVRRHQAAQAPADEGQKRTVSNMLKNWLQRS